MYQEYFLGNYDKNTDFKFITSLVILAVAAPKCLVPLLIQHVYLPKVADGKGSKPNQMRPSQVRFLKRNKFILNTLNSANI